MGLHQTVDAAARRSLHCLMVPRRRHETLETYAIEGRCPRHASVQGIAPRSTTRRGFHKRRQRNTASS